MVISLRENELRWSFVDEMIVRMIAGLIHGEADGEPTEGQIAVAWTVRNRVLNPSWWGKSWLEVILKPFQYSCWNFDKRGFPDWERVTELIEKATAAQLYISMGVYFGYIVDPTGGATHYHASYVDPAWAGSEMMEYLKTIGNHLFYREH